MKSLAPTLRHLARQAYWLALIALIYLASSPVVWAAKKKAAEAAPTKSYVGPWIWVLMLVSVGLMTICRPQKRKDRPDEKKAEED